MFVRIKQVLARRYLSRLDETLWEDARAQLIEREVEEAEIKRLQDPMSF